MTDSLDSKNEVSQLMKEAEMNKFYSSISILNQNIRKGYEKMDSIEQDIKIIDEYARRIDYNKNFSIKIKKPQIYTHKLGPGQFATNCVCCNRTCHFPCTIADDCDKHRCSVMDSLGYCTICRCHWSSHHNMPYRFEIQEVEEVKTMNVLKEAYGDAVNKKLKTEKMLENAKNEYKQIWDQIAKWLAICKECIHHLQENANGPITLHRVDEIKHQIEEEKQQRKIGWKERVRDLHELLQQHELIEAICQGRENDLLPKRI